MAQLKCFVVSRRRRRIPEDRQKL